jgi:Trypsin-like peptidase domain
MSRPLTLLWRGGFAVLMLVSAASRSAAQTGELIDVDLRSTLPVIGRTQILSGAKLYKLFPLEDGAYVQKLDYPGTPSFRVHFSVVSVPKSADARWNVKIINFDNDQQRWSLCSDDASCPENPVLDFWSNEIKGSRARVVVTANAAARNLQIIIDKIAFLQAVTIPQTEINFKLKPIGQTGASIQRAGRSIARLLIQRDEDGLTVPCTGFLVGRDLLMTNRHCVRSGSEARNTDVQFDYDMDGAQPVQVGVKELVLTSCDLDFVLLRLNKPFACQSQTCNGDYERAPLALSRTASLTVGQQLLVIQHPDGEAKQVSREGCVVDKLLMMGSSSSTTDFAHKCDTKGGSSGSPIQLIGAGDVVGPVVGLHHLGFRIDTVQETDPKQINRAVSSQQIVAYINQVKPALINELAVQ